MDEIEEIYGAINIIHRGETYFIEYLYTPDNTSDFDIITVDTLSGHPVEEYELRRELVIKSEDKIISKIKSESLYN